MPDVMREDAFKLCTDEAHHAYFSDDVERQVVQATGLVPDYHGTPRFLRQLRTLQRDLPSELIVLSELLFSVVSETLISTILAQIPKDERVVTAVRNIVADHAEDEGRHSAYFSQFFAYLWPQLSCEQRSVLGPLLPRFIRTFLEPDLEAVGRGLARYPLEHDQVRTVLEQCYPTARIAADARQAAKGTLRLFEHSGVLDDPRIADAFRACELAD
jgi:P-aminobenzoate N-oxygenase AurF